MSEEKVLKYILMFHFYVSKSFIKMQVEIRKRLILFITIVVNTGYDPITMAP